MRKVHPTLPRFPVLLACILLLAGCGVPSAALDQARLQAIATQPVDPAPVRAALLAQAAQWQDFSALVSRRQLGGIWPVDAEFESLVRRTAAIARRQADLIAQNQDAPELNRALLQEFTQRWQQAQRYLEQ